MFISGYANIEKCALLFYKITLVLLHVYNNVFVHFESEGNCAVFAEEFINEDEFQEMNNVNVWLGKGKHSRLFPAIQ